MAKVTNNDLQNTTQKTKDRATYTSLKTEVGGVEMNSGAPEGLAVCVVKCNLHTMVLF